MSQISNLLFDLGSVLVDIDIPAGESNLGELLRPGTPRQDIEDIAQQFETGKISQDQFINQILAVAKPGVSASELRSAWNSMLLGIPLYRFTMLEQLRENYNLYLLSNTNTLHIDWLHQYLAQRHGIYDFEKTYFHEVFYSHLIGDRKPNPTIFQFVVRTAMITPGKTLFIDDLKVNIREARKLGFQTCLIAEGEEVAEVLKVKRLY